MSRPVSWMSRIGRCAPWAAALVFATACSQGTSPTEPAPAAVTSAATAAQTSPGAATRPAGPRGGLEALAGPGVAGDAALAAAAAAVPRDQAAGTDGATDAAGLPGALAPARGPGRNAEGVRLTFQPDVWNLQWSNAEGTVSAVLEGAGVAGLDASTVELVGDAGTIFPRRTDLNGPNRLRARFGMGDALGVLASPQVGETHELTVRFMADGEAGEATATVRIVGPSGGDGGGGDGEGGGEGDGEAGSGEVGDLSVEIQPATWNTNWSHNSGQVSVKISGPGFRGIDADTVVLVGDTGEELEAKRTQKVGNHVRAVFAMHKAISLLADATPGQTYDVIVRFELDGDLVEAMVPVRVVGQGGGNGGGGGGEPDDYSLRLQPDAWNVNWSHNSGQVAAKLEGPALGQIESDSIVLVGEAGEVEPKRVQRRGNHLRVIFAMHKAIEILDDADPGEIHEVILRFTVDGDEVEVTAPVRVVGPGA